MALLNCNFCSTVLGCNTQLTVLLPERRHQPRQAEDRHYPVLYALHGHGQDHTNWQRDGYLEHLLKEEDVIVVMPNCVRSFYADAKEGHRYFTYLTEELPIIVGNYFPASRRREDTYIAGISMGGYGALHAAFLRPDLYAGVASLSGALDPFIATESAPQGMFGCTDLLSNIRHIFGTHEEFLAGTDYLHRAFDAMLAAGGPAPDIYLCCGEQDFLYGLNAALRDHIAERTPGTFRFEGTDGEHSWDYWNKMMPRVLDGLGLVRRGRQTLGYLA